jgi:F0F1-type ATP synthase assembly protein I
MLPILDGGQHMARRKLFRYLAAAAGYIGIGLILGYVLSDQTTNTPLWVGIVLTLLGAILLGMFISARDDSAPTATVSSSGSPSAYSSDDKM